MIKNLIGIILFLSIATTAISETIAPSPAELKTAIKLAEQGNAEAQFNLGVMYANGEGVRQNKTTAKEWFGKACDNGTQQGCDEYRKLNETGY